MIQTKPKHDARGQQPMSFFDYPTSGPDSPPPTQVLLADASEAEWATLLDFTQAKRFGAGQGVLEAGGGGRSLYLLLEGTLEVVAPATRFGRRRSLARLEAGSVVGEVSFFDGKPRSAGVRALTPVVLAELTPEGFDSLASKHPDLSRRLLLDLGRILAGRLRRTEAAVGTSGPDAI
jgi:CRP/FNR family transcriptional regulator, cyclic AMP receptor protein